MKILVFVSKWVGNECIRTLFSEFANDDYLFIVSNPDADKIIELIQKHNHKYLILNQDTIKFINSHNKFHFDWLLNLWGAYIFNEEILLKAKKSLNVHPSFLPFDRGRDPIVWAIRKSHPAGVTLHQITEGVDEGPIIFQEEVKYNFPENGRVLYDRVIQRCHTIFGEQWPKIRSSKDKPITQKQNNIINYRKNLIDDRIINLDENEPNWTVISKILAHDFDKDYCSLISYQGKIYDVKLVIKERIDDYEE